MKRKAIALTLVMTILVLTVIIVLIAIKSNPSSFDNSDRNSLFIASFSPATIGSNVTGGELILVNPTNKNFENLTLTIKIDDSELIVPFLRLWMHLPFDNPLSSFTVPITQIIIGAHDNETIQLYLFDPSRNETSQLYLTSVNVQTFSSHVFRFYITQNTFGDIVNGQSLTIPQEKAYLQIKGYSSIEHDNDTWHEYFNSSTNQFEYINDQPNFYQQYHHSAYYPMEPNSYNWAKTQNQLGEHYFNITVFNNSTVLVERIAVNLGEGWGAYALPDKILQPNETYVFPVAVNGENWWNINNVNQLSNFSPAQTYASGDLIGSQK